MAEPLIDRRPIAARRLRVMQRLADALVRRRVSPNAISLAGMGAAACAGLSFAAAQSVWVLWLAAAVLVQARLLANLLDGMVAIGSGRASPLGEIFNEVPDRASDTAVLAGMGLAAHSPALGLGAALAAMATAYIRAVGKPLTGTSDFGGPMAKQHRMAVATSTALLCPILPSAYRGAACALALAVIVLFSLLTAGLRLRRIARALRR